MKKTNSAAKKDTIKMTAIKKTNPVKKGTNENRNKTAKAAEPIAEPKKAEPKTSLARREASKKYIATLDEIHLRGPKGFKNELKQYAESNGYPSLNDFAINTLRKAIQK